MECKKYLKSLAVSSKCHTFARMKQMRLFILAAIILLLAGCLQDKVGGVRVYSEPNVELYSIPNQTSEFLFYASGPWKAACTEPWLQVMKESGPGGADTLKVVTTQKNLTGEVRKAIVTIVADGELKTVEVTQRDEFAEFDQDEFSLPAEGGMLDVTFRSNFRDSLVLYVTGTLAKYLEDTRDEDSTQQATRTEFKGRINWLRVLPNTDTVPRKGFFYLAFALDENRHVSLDTLKFQQAAFVPDSLKGDSLK